MESTNRKSYRQMEVLRPSERPENEFPIGQTSFADDAQTPDRFQEGDDITKSISRLVVSAGFEVLEKGQNTFVIVFG
jgi:hypothetical protein